MASIDWSSLTFKYMKTNCHVRHIWRNGAWDAGSMVAEDTITMSIAANCFHYGQAAFEGLKAFGCKDGKVRIFRASDNSRRLNESARRLVMPEVPEQLFLGAVSRAVRANIEFVPPYGTGGSMYIRPLLIGTGATIGVSPSDEFHFLVFVMPVGPYYKGNIQPVEAYITLDYDRAAPNGTGNIKSAGNYAAGLLPSQIAKKKGYPINLYLDAKTHTFIDEFATSNFFAITRRGSYVTPDSHSVLPSVTNKALMQIAQDLGIKVERRPVHVDELPAFVEVAACGTAVVATPISKIVYKDQVFEYSKECGPVTMNLYKHIQGIQYGELPDTHGWTVEV